MTESSQPLDSQFGANSISLDLLQQRLHHRLETTGALDRLRAQLRQHVLNELRGAGARSCDDRARQYSTYDRALNAVIADFLRRHDHVYALSVFLSESSTDPDLFQASDLERLLCLPEKSVENENSSKSILTVVVELAARLKSNSLVSCAIQTDGTNDELEFSLRLIDQKYRRQSKDEDDAAQQCVEERISKQIREIEQRAAETLKQEIERIRITEIAAVRISESEKHQQDLDAVRQQFERQYHERLEQLRVKEQENNQILEKRKQAFESLEYDRRQQLLAEIETIKLRDVDLKRGVELEKRALQLERESIRKELEDAKRRADVFEKELERKAYSMELRSAEYDASHRYILDQEKIELEHVSKDYNDKRKWLEQEKESYQKCKLMLEETHEQLRLKEQEIQELLQIKSKLHEANTAVGQLQQKLDEVLQAKRDLEKDLTLKVKENEMFSSQLKSLEKQFQDERRNFESSLASIQSEHELAFQVYKSEFSKQQKNLQNQILVLSKELSERLDEEDKVRMRYEDEQLRSKSLWREVTGLKSYIDELQCQNKIRTKTTAGKFRTNYGRTATVFSKTHTSYLEFKQDQKTESVEKENLFSLHANKEEEDHRSNETPEKAKRKGSFLQSEVETDQIKVSKITEKDDTKRQESHESVTDLVKHDLISTEVDVTLRQLNASDVKDEAHDADKLVKVPDNLDLDSNQANTINDSSTTSNGILSTTIGPNPELISRDGANTETVKDLSNENTDLSTYLVTNAEEQSTNDETAQIAQMNFRMPPDSNTQNKTLDLANEFGSSKNREPNEIDQEKIEQIEDLKKKEDMEKKREEMILRAAQQRKERDERERRERFSNRRSNFTTYSNNATVSRAPPAKRFFNIGDENK